MKKTKNITAFIGGQGVAKDTSDITFAAASNSLGTGKNKDVVLTDLSSGQELNKRLVSTLRLDYEGEQLSILERKTISNYTTNEKFLTAVANSGFLIVPRDMAHHIFVNKPCKNVFERKKAREGGNTMTYLRTELNKGERIDAKIIQRTLQMFGSAQASAFINASGDTFFNDLLKNKHTKLILVIDNISDHLEESRHLVHFADDMMVAYKHNGDMSISELETQLEYGVSAVISAEELIPHSHAGQFDSSVKENMTFDILYAVAATGDMPPVWTEGQRTSWEEMMPKYDDHYCDWDETMGEIIEDYQHRYEEGFRCMGITQKHTRCLNSIEGTRDINNSRTGRIIRLCHQHQAQTKLFL